MKKKILAMLLAVALMASLAVPALADTPADVYHCECGAKVFASAEAETPSIKNEECMEGCDEVKNLTWKPLTAQPCEMIDGQWIDAVKKAEWSVGEDYNFYLTGPVETTYKLKLGDTANGGVEGTTVRVDLNGYSYYRGANNVFQVTGGSHLVITDTSSGKNGVLGTKSITADYQGIVVVNEGTAKQFAGTIDGSAYASRAGSTNVSVTGGAYYMYDGKIVNGKSSAGGNVRVTGGEFHMYDGTISGGVAAARAGNVLVEGGTFHMHGGTISGGSTINADGHGGNVHVRDSGNVGGTFIMDDGLICDGNAGAARGGNVALIGTNSKVTINGGTITGGQAKTGPCVHKLYGTMTVSGDPVIDSIHLDADQKIVVGEGGMKEGASVGIWKANHGIFASAGAVEADAKYFYDACPDNKHGVREGAEAGTLAMSPTPWKLNGTGDRLTHDEAKAALKEGDYLQLQYNWGTAPEFSGNVCLDLNGHTLTGLKVTDGKLNLFDSATNDYDVSDDVYGKITGDITADEIVRDFVASNGYRYVTVKTEAGYSAHRIYLAVTHSVLSSGCNAMNYKTVLKCDSVIADLVNEYGFTLTVELPDAVANYSDTFKDTTVGAWDGSNNNEKTTTVIGHLKGDANDATFAVATCTVNAYIKLSDELNEDVTSAKQSRTLKEMVEAVVANWDVEGALDDYQKATLMELYDTYGATAGMDSWNIPEAMKQ